MPDASLSNSVMIAAHRERTPRLSNSLVPGEGERPAP